MGRHNIGILVKAQINRGGTAILPDSYLRDCDHIRERSDALLKQLDLGVITWITRWHALRVKHDQHVRCWLMELRRQDIRQQYRLALRNGVAAILQHLAYRPRTRHTARREKQP